MYRYEIILLRIRYSTGIFENHKFITEYDAIFVEIFDDKFRKIYSNDTLADTYVRYGTGTVPYFVKMNLYDTVQYGMVWYGTVR